MAFAHIMSLMVSIVDTRMDSNNLQVLLIVRWEVSPDVRFGWRAAENKRAGSDDSRKR